MRNVLLLVFFLCACVSSGQVGYSQKISVSGISSGAYMAVQLAISYSGTIQHVASFAGGPFGCSQGSVLKSVQCMQEPDKIDEEVLVQNALTLEQSGQVDSLTNLKNSRVFLFQGQADSIVKKESVLKLQKFFSRWVSESQIKTLIHEKAGHAIVTTNKGVLCGENASPFIEKCDVDLVINTIEFLLGSPRGTPSEVAIERLRPLEQSRFSSDESFAKEAFVYTPQSCNGSRSCGVHVALHGCKQSTEFVSDTFIKDAGYLEAAEKFGIKVLFPNVKSSPKNPMGCWDWWGYTGQKFLTKDAPQISGLMAMAKFVLEN